MARHGKPLAKQSIKSLTSIFSNVGNKISRLGLAALARYMFNDLENRSKPHSFTLSVKSVSRVAQNRQLVKYPRKKTGSQALRLSALTSKNGWCSVL